MFRAYDIFYYSLENVVHATKSNIMDNEESTSLKQLLQNRDIGTTRSTPYT